MERSSFQPGPGSWGRGPKPRAAQPTPRANTNMFSAQGLPSELPALTQILPGDREEAAVALFFP